MGSVEYMVSDPWQASLAMWRAGFDTGDLVVMDAAKNEMAKMIREAEASEIRLAIRAKALLEGGWSKIRVAENCAELEAHCKHLTLKMADLRPILKRGARVTQQQNSPGPNPAVVNHPVENSLQGIPDGLKIAAMDIQWGWSILVGKTQPKDGGYEPKEPGQGEPGTQSTKAEQQYLDWVKEMHRCKMSPWAVEDFICKNRSYAEIAKLRRVEVETVRLMVLTGLTIYQGMFEPLDRRE